MAVLHNQRQVQESQLHYQLNLRSLSYLHASNKALLKTFTPIEFAYKHIIIQLKLSGKNRLRHPAVITEIQEILLLIAF